MNISKSKLLFCLAICFAVLFTPFLLGVSLDGKANAMGFLGSSSSSGNSSGDGVNLSSPSSAPAAYPNPEPATLLLFGAGAVGLAVAIKKFRKK
jgi:hypothetical protein